MLAPRTRLLPSVPPAVRLGFLGLCLALLAYVALVWQPSEPTPVEVVSPVEPAVVVPQVDAGILAGARDATREERLLLEAEPLRHLLTLAIDVGPTVASALGMPEQPLAVADLRENTNARRGRWLFCEGLLEELTGPHGGHPISGYWIHDATIRLADGERVMGTFSMPPDGAIVRGSWVRLEGFFLKLRDTTWPQAISKAPMLVGRGIQRDYEDWGPVLRLDPAILDKVDDASFLPGGKVWHTIEEDQTEALWHLAAFVRDTSSQRTPADWRRIDALSAHDTHGALLANRIARGSPMRVFGTLIRRITVAAPANPAGIESWTVAWVQVREFGGRLVPIWVPKRVADLPVRAQLEVRGFYYRWFAYEAQDDERHRVPLFLAADLDLHRIDVDRTMQQLGIWLALAAIAMVAVFWWLQRRAARLSLAYGRDRDARRRRRRERAEARAPSSGSATTP
ncbi:MAG TPA: hypothetical protein VF384_19010 [Planctomycetota bacterium]